MKCVGDLVFSPLSSPFLSNLIFGCADIVTLFERQKSSSRQNVTFRTFNGRNDEGGSRWWMAAAREQYIKRVDDWPSKEGDEWEESREEENGEGHDNMDRTRMCSTKGTQRTQDVFVGFCGNLGSQFLLLLPDLTRVTHHWNRVPEWNRVPDQVLSGSLYH